MNGNTSNNEISENTATFARMPDNESTAPLNPSAPPSSNDYISSNNPYNNFREEDVGDSVRLSNDVVVIDTDYDSIYLLRNISERALLLEKMGKTVQ